LTSAGRQFSPRTFGEGQSDAIWGELIDALGPIIGPKADRQSNRSSSPHEIGPQFVRLFLALRVGLLRGRIRRGPAPGTPVPRTDLPDSIATSWHSFGVARTWNVPSGVRAVKGPRGLRLIGEAGDLIDAFDDLRAPAVPEDDVVLAPWRLTSSNNEPEDLNPYLIVYSADAWLWAPGLLQEIANGQQSSPFDFSFAPSSSFSLDGHYLGASLLGVTRYDFGRLRMNELTPPESWPAARARLETYGLGAVMYNPYVSDRTWAANLGALQDGEVVVEGFAVADTLEELTDLLIHQPVSNIST